MRLGFNQDLDDLIAYVPPLNSVLGKTWVSTNLWQILPPPPPTDQAPHTSHGYSHWMSHHRPGHSVNRVSRRISGGWVAKGVVGCSRRHPSGPGGLWWTGRSEKEPRLSLCGSQKAHSKASSSPLGQHRDRKDPECDSWRQRPQSLSDPDL